MFLTRDGGAASAAGASPSVVTVIAPQHSVAAVHDVEHRVLSAVFGKPQRLPRRWVDPITGLPKDGIKVHCRRRRSGTSFRCGLRSSGDPRSLNLVVRYYSPTTRLTFKWPRADAR